MNYETIDNIAKQWYHHEVPCLNWVAWAISDDAPKWGLKMKKGKKGKKWDHSKLPEHKDWFWCPNCNMEFAVNFYKGEEKKCPCGNTEGLEWVKKET
jgi:hypothetical protein